ncbi:carbon monoxide dehydrogenase subunit G [Bradyrhizobium sp. CW7]|uniref:SRPBCC family protein n=1 Tax=Bradyrhizobium sp. CW7 TaxID=2782688 RepID=UPI001FFAADA6|nr:carbon monoxide dehydrogenase subunit G [Bradyrhizobium sp. CW7]MCK1356254.1 carbon monoxide dehydrogenase subunit G [Bradyrhizobium sp. CW7]
MDMHGQKIIGANPDAVWRALNDPAVLRASIPGCQELNKISDTEMTAEIVIKVGPISARLKGKVTLSDLDPPRSCRISGEGQGGVAGFAKGIATVNLEEHLEGTLLNYRVDAEVGGKLAQLGSRMIDATNRKISEEFFQKFSTIVEQGGLPPGSPAIADKVITSERVAEKTNELAERTDGPEARPPHRPITALRRSR